MDEPPDRPSRATLRKRRGIIRASITRLAMKVWELEARTHEPPALNLAHRMSHKLDALDSEFRTHHYALIDSISDEEEEALSKEQEALDHHDDNIAELATRVECLIATCDSASDSGVKVASRRLTHLESSICAVSDAISSLDGNAEPHLLHQYQE